MALPFHSLLPARSLRPSTSDSRRSAVQSTEGESRHFGDYPIFANRQHSYQMVLLEQSAQCPSNYPPYDIVLLKVNTRYRHAIPIERKTKEAINDAITTFIVTTPFKSIVSNDEFAFASKMVLETLTSNVISLRIITDRRLARPIHSTEEAVRQEPILRFT